MKYKNTKITGFKTSAAFNTLKRETLLKVLSEVIDYDYLWVMRFLPNKTSLNIMIRGTMNSRYVIKGNIKTPQGDRLSPVLFIVCLE